MGAKEDKQALLCKGTYRDARTATLYAKYVELNERTETVLMF